MPAVVDDDLSIPKTPCMPGSVAVKKTEALTPEPSTTASFFALVYILPEKSKFAIYLAYSNCTEANMRENQNALLTPAKKKE